jgi:mannose-1-phosphate guanylyltransferase
MSKRPIWAFSEPDGCRTFPLATPLACRVSTVEALILAAGEGTRLLPLTRHKPKPLFPVLNRPLLALTLDYLKRHQIRRVILNTHHLGNQVRSFLEEFSRDHPNWELATRPEPEILGTGGAIKNSADFWQKDPFLVVNGDIVTDLDLTPALEFHRGHGGPITLVLHDQPLYNNIVLSPEGNILKIRDPEGAWAFTGIQLLDRRIFDFLPPVGFYDIIPVYQKLIAGGIPVRGHVSRGHYWRDMGSPDSYRALHREILTGAWTPPLDFSCRKQEAGPIWCLGPLVEIPEDARLEGWGALGEQCRLGRGCRVRNSILWKGVRVGEGVFIEDSIVGDGVFLNENISNKIIC